MIGSVFMAKPRIVGQALIFAAALTTGVALESYGSSPASAAQATPAQLQTVLSQMDAASAKFTSAQADMRQELFTKAVQDTETQTGAIYFQRKGTTMQMGMKILPPDAQPGAAPAQVLELKDGKLRIFNPGTNHIDEISTAGKNQAFADTLTTLGFGASGTSLAKAWNITDQGAEQMSDGSKSLSVEKLDLVSKDPKIRNSFSHITLWIDASRGVPLKEVSYEASGGTSTGDTRTAIYTNIRLNQPVDAGPFAIKCKGSCSITQQ
jgi:outer membrane lipoprotein-sorting protein